MHAKVLLEPRRESRLLGFWKKGIIIIKVLSEQMTRPHEAIRQNLKRMAIVVGQQKIMRTTTTEVVPKDLLTLRKH